jgi:hypothetical protein
VRPTRPRSSRRAVFQTVSPSGTWLSSRTQSSLISRRLHD